MNAFICPLCNKGKIVPTVKAGRLMNFKKTRLELPSEVAVPTCSFCDEEFMDRDTARQLDRALNRVYSQLQSKG